MRTRILDGVIEGGGSDSRRKGGLLQLTNKRYVVVGIERPMRPPPVMSELRVWHRIELGACKMPPIEADKNGS